MTRLDLALWGTPSKRKFKNILFSYYYLIVSLIKKLFTFQKKQNLNNKYIFIFEDFKLSKNLIHKEDYYFKKVKDFFPNYKNIIIGFKIYNDKKNFSILQLTQKKEALKILIISILIYIKFLFLKNQIFKKQITLFFGKIIILKIIL